MSIKLVKASNEYQDLIVDMLKEWIDYNNNHSEANTSPASIFKNDYHNFDYYINKNNTVYSISKDNQCCSSFFGALEYFFNIYIYKSQKDIKLTQKAYNLLLAEIKSSYYYRAIEKRILENSK